MPTLRCYVLNFVLKDKQLFLTFILRRKTKFSKLTFFNMTQHIFLKTTEMKTCVFRRFYDILDRKHF